MSFEIENDYQFGDTVVLTMKALEDLEKGDRVEIVNGTEAQKSPNGAWVVVSPRPVEAGCYVEVREGYFQSSAGSGSADNTIYNTDGTLTANRTVTQDGNSLAIEGGEFEQSRVDGVFTRAIQNNTNVGGSNTEGIGIYQESDTHLSAIFAGDSTNNGGTANEVTMVVINEDFASNGVTNAGQVIAKVGALEMRGVDSTGIGEITINPTQGITLNASGGMPSSGIRLLGNGLNPATNALLGIRPDGYVEVVSDVIAAFDRQTVSLIANTPLTISSASVSDIHSIQAYDSSGEMITLRVAKSANANERIVESNVSLTDVLIEIVGVA